MTKAHFDQECDECIRRNHRTAEALRILGHARKKSLEDASVAAVFALDAADRYLEEALFSHPEHGMPPWAEAEHALSSRLDYAQKHFEFARNKSLEDPMVSKADVLEAQRYADEVRSSCAKHRVPRRPDTEGAAPGQGDTQYASGDQTNTQQEQQTEVGPKPRSNTDSSQPPPHGASDPSLRRLQSNVTKSWEHVDTEVMLKYLWTTGQTRLDRVMKFEENSGLPHPHGNKMFGELTKVATAFMEYGSRTKIFKPDGDGEIDVSQMTPAAQEFAKLDVVDRNLIHELRRRFVKMVGGDFEKEINQELGTYYPTERDEEPSDNDGSSEEPDPEST